MQLSSVLGLVIGWLAWLVLFALALILLLLVLLLVLLLLVLLLLGLRVLLLGWTSVWRSLLALTCSSHLLVVGLVLSQNLFSHFLLSLMDIRIELVSIFSNWEFLIVVDRNVDFFRANWLLIRVMELCYVWMLKWLFSS